MKYREGEPLAAREEGLRAELGVDAGARLQRKIEPGRAVRAVGELGESRCLEALSHVAVEIERRGHRVDQPRDGAGVLEADLAAVVGIRTDDEVVLRIERNLGVPQARKEAPARSEFPLGLRIKCSAPRRVVLVALQS